jgi:hypothetical protein
VGASRDRLYAILAFVLATVPVLATNPWLEMGINDDWSYTWVARRLAETGHLTYNGWIGAIIGVQAVWGALAIRVFGFSFTVVRLSTLPFAGGCAVLLYRLGRSAGLNASMALFGALSVMLSPVLIPESASFMTDVPGLFFWLASIYGGVLAVEAGSTARACVWMAVAAAAGVAGGTIRQVVWFVPVMVLPVAAWMLRKERAVVIFAGLVWCASGVAMALCLLWFNAQPYGFTPTPYELEPWFDAFLESVESLVEIAVSGLLLMIPVLALYLAGWRQWGRAPRRVAIGLGGAGVLLAGIGLFGDSLLLGNIVTPTGVLGQGLEMPGVKPEILTAPIRMALGAVVVVTAGITAAAGLDRFRAADHRLRLFVWLFGPASLVYAAAIVYRSVNQWILFDRYVIVLMPLVIVPLLWRFQHSLRPTVPVWGWGLIGLFAAYGIATTHDYMASGRARLRAASAVTAAGVPRRQVSAGLEYDGWTQLEQTGRIPSPLEQAAAPPRRYPISPPYWYWAKTPSVEPVYIVTYSRLAGLMDSQFPPVEFTTWLPPFRRWIFTQKAP